MCNKRNYSFYFQFRLEVIAFAGQFEEIRWVIFEDALNSVPAGAVGSES